LVRSELWVKLPVGGVMPNVEVTPKVAIVL
jgi:hypothetical protein